MQINQLNYELYAIDYLEGTLSVELQEAMEQFLLAHPEIRRELMGLEEMTLRPTEDLVFEKKASLIKSERKPVIWGIWLWAAVLVLGLSTFGIYFVQHATLDTSKEQLLLTKEPASLETQEKLVNPVIVPEQKATVSTEIQKEPKAQNLRNNKVVPITTPKEESVTAKVNTTKINTLSKGQEVLRVDTPKTKEVNSIVPRIDSLLEEHKILKKQNLSSQPMAVLSPKPLSNEHQKGLMIDAQNLADGTTFGNEVEEAKEPKERKGIKTPFGRIRLNEIAEAFVPEYFASVGK